MVRDRGLMHRHTTHNKCYATFKDFSIAMLHFLRNDVPRNWPTYCDEVTDNFRVIDPTRSPTTWLTLQARPRDEGSYRVIESHHATNPARRLCHSPFRALPCPDRRRPDEVLLAYCSRNEVHSVHRPSVVEDWIADGSCQGRKRQFWIGPL